MSYIKQKAKDYYLLDTAVENIFVSEYMTAAPGDYVKVYLFALMYADLDQDVDGEIVAKQLNIDEEDVLKAWTYWERLGVVRKIRQDSGNKFDYKVEFLNLKERLYGKAPKEKQPLDEDVRSAMDDEDIREMYSKIEKLTGKPMSGTQMMEMISWIKDLGATPEMIVQAYKYCIEQKKRNIKYVAAIVRDWSSKGLTETSLIEEHLKETDQKQYHYKRVMKALGFKRFATEEECRIMDVWFDDMDMTIDAVLDACRKTSGISNPNINYVNKVLINKAGGDGSKNASSSDGRKGQVSTSTVLKYYEELQRRDAKEAEGRRQQVYDKIPEMSGIESRLDEISKETSKLIVSNRQDKEAKIQKLKKESQKLLSEKAFLLTENNFELTFMDVEYKCEICRDSGTTETGARCECFPLRAKEAEIWANSGEK